MRLHHMPERTVDEIRRFVGNGVRKLIERAVPEATAEEEIEAVLDDFRSYYLQHDRDTTRPYEGIIDALNELRAAGMKIAVVSNKFYKATEALCSHFFGELVDVAIGENEAGGIKKKPAPDTVFEAVRRLGADLRECVYIGDSDVDVATARNSGIDCISVLWGFRDKEFLTAHGADKFAVNPGDLPALFLG